MLLRLPPPHPPPSAVKLPLPPLPRCALQQAATITSDTYRWGRGWGLGFTSTIRKRLHKIFGFLLKQESFPAFIYAFIESLIYISMAS